MYKPYAILYILWLYYSVIQDRSLQAPFQKVFLMLSSSCINVVKVNIFPIHRKKNRYKFFLNSLFSLIICLKILVATTTYLYNNNIQLLPDLA